MTEPMYDCSDMPRATVRICDSDGKVLEKGPLESEEQEQIVRAVMGGAHIEAYGYQRGTSKEEDIWVVSISKPTPDKPCPTCGGEIRPAWDRCPSCDSTGPSDSTLEED